MIVFRPFDQVWVLRLEVDERRHNEEQQNVMYN